MWGRHFSILVLKIIQFHLTSYHKVIIRSCFGAISLKKIKNKAKKAIYPTISALSKGNIRINLFLRSTSCSSRLAKGFGSAQEQDIGLVIKGITLGKAGSRQRLADVGIIQLSHWRVLEGNSGASNEICLQRDGTESFFAIFVALPCRLRE